ncbi:MAG: M23 family metallopeptidase [Chromatiales bacterium]|jgi:murein DD-endopeptidase MepM/ murein hydrolase activator NlpD
MNIILLNSFCKRKGSIEICLSSLVPLFVIAGLLVVGVSAGLGFYFGQKVPEWQQQADNSRLLEMLDTDKQMLEQEKARMQAHVDALAIRLGSLQAHVMRLDALGDRLVDVAQLDKGEFDFNSEPAMGGLDASENSTSPNVGELVADVDAFNELLQDRVLKLDLLEEMIATGQLREETTPSGKPVLKGWLSSRYGKRIDPKNGKKTFHRGLDFAGKKGADVIAVASGVITRAEYQKGFGYMVEVKHSDGYSTIYAHNKENLVQVGDLVKKGQRIALLGSTGRSTGPHVHFEVRRDKRVVNPAKFVNR